MVLDSSILYISKLAEKSSDLAAAARVLSDTAGGEGRRGGAEQP